MFLYRRNIIISGLLYLRTITDNNISNEQISKPAPKRKKPMNSSVLENMKLPSADDMPKTSEAKAELNSEKIKKQLDHLSQLPSEKLEELVAQYSEKENLEAKMLAEDNIYQMEVSTRLHYQGSPKVFWKSVGIERVNINEAFGEWYYVLLGKHRVKAFETKRDLVVPGKDFAAAIANEWEAQSNHVNKCLMPLTDLASGAHHVSLQMIAPRVDYLMSFFSTDNAYFRVEPIVDKQDALIESITHWYGELFDFEVPRVTGIGHPQLPIDASDKVRSYLHNMDMNPFQIVSLCVIAQCTASIMLPLALINKKIDLQTVIDFNSAEEKHNELTQGHIEGHHDIRDQDQLTKLCASICGYRMAETYSAQHCGKVLSFTYK